MPSNDLISRSAAIAAATECLFKPIGAYGFPTEKQIKDAIDALPADRRWEELRMWIVSSRCDVDRVCRTSVGDGMIAAFSTILKTMDRLAPAADGAEDNKDEQ